MIDDNSGQKVAGLRHQEHKFLSGLYLHEQSTNFLSIEEVRINTHTTDKAEFTKQIEERIEAIGKRFQELELTAMKAGEVDARAKIETARKAITQRRHALEQQLRATRNAGDSAFAEMKEGVVAAWTELNDAFERAREELEGVTA